MKGEMWIVQPDGHSRCVARDRRPSLEELQEAVGGGTIQLVPDWAQCGDKGRCVAFCNDDGLEKRMPVNIFATQMWRQDLDRQKAQHGVDYDPNMAVLVGPVVVLVGDAEFLGISGDDE